MQLERYRPQPPLDAFVDYLWHLSDAPGHARERILPNGTLELVFNLAEDEIRIYDDTAAQPGVEQALDARPAHSLSGCVVSGVFRRFFVIDTREHACMLGAHFKPGGAFPFLRRLPALELANSHRDLRAIWGCKAPALRARLVAAASVPERFQLLETALLEELGAAPGGHRVVPAVIYALSSPGASIGELASHAHLTHRRLIELFSLEVGSTPKLFQRVHRFQRALALARGSVASAPLVETAGGSSTARVAQVAGYCDQSHWIRDCLAFSGMTPAQYSSQHTTLAKEHHVPLG